MDFAVDLHVHTTYGSLDSALTADGLGAALGQRGLDGAVIAEHATQWPVDRAVALAAACGRLIVPAREWHSEYGHILVLGLDDGAPRAGTPDVRWILQAALGGGASARFNRPVREMREHIDERGGALILAHPFRNFPGPRNLLFGGRPETWEWPPARLAEHPVFSLVHAIEVLNGDCSPAENALARAVADARGLCGTGGSDAHAPHEVGRYVTVFERPLADASELLRELRAGRVVAASRPGGAC
jgi:predicted metal-dependent phosphoesterase TrpH